MALVPATITVNFTAYYTLGCHRVCYSTNPLGPFDDCVEETFVSAGPASIEVPILVDPESCDPVTYYGYIQACCEELGSLNGRVTWNATYTPTPTCTAVRFTANTDPSTPYITNTGNFCSDSGEIQTKAIGTEFVLCYDGGTSGPNFLAAAGAPGGWLAQGYTYLDDPSVCCNDCVTVSVSGTGNYQYVDCTGQLINASVTGSATICAKVDSWSANYPATIMFSQTAPTCTIL